MTDLARLRIAVDTKDLTKADAALKKLEATGSSTTGSLVNLSSVFKTVAASMAVKEAIQYADTMKLIEGRLTLVTSSASNLTRIQKELFDISQKSRVGFADTADLYARIARSTESLGYSQKELLNVTETISKSFVISGASAESANAAIIQLGQGFASGTLRGDELNSVLEQSPRLAQAIAEGMGVTIGELRSLGAEGKITAASVMNSLKSQGDAISSEFGKMPVTVGQSMVQMNNSIMALVGGFDKAAGSTDGISGGITNLAQLIDQNRGGIIEFGLDFARAFEVAGSAVALTYLEAKQTMLQMKNFFTSGDGLAEEISIIEEQMKLLAADMDSTIQKITEDTQATIENTKAHEDNLEAKGVAVGVTNTTPEMTDTGKDYSAHIYAYEEYLTKLEENKDRLMATLYPTEGLDQQHETQQELIAELRERELISENEFLMAKTKMKADHDMKQMQLEDNKSKVIKGMQQSVAMEAIALLGTLAGKNKAAAIAGIAIQKGIAIATTIANTQAASMLAFSSQLIPGDPTSIARAAAAASAVESLGAVKVGLIAATGLMQMGGAMGGGGGGGIGGGGAPNSGGYGSNQPMNDNLLSGAITKEEAPTTKEVTINLGDNAFVSTEMVRELVKSINDEIGDGVRIRT